MHKCKTGKHYWLKKEDADKCCNGYVRVLTFNSGNNQQRLVDGVNAGRAWMKIKGKE